MRAHRGRHAHDNRAGYKTSGPTGGRQAHDNRAGYTSRAPREKGKPRTIERATKSSGPTDIWKHKHRTIEQAIKWLGHRARESQDNRAGYKICAPTKAGTHMTIEQAIKLAGPQRQAST